MHVESTTDGCARIYYTHFVVSLLSTKQPLHSIKIQVFVSSCKLICLKRRLVNFLVKNGMYFRWFSYEYSRIAWA